MRPSLIALAFIAASALLPSTAQAQYCEGTVRGLSATYNASTGAGFLAVRTAPRSLSAKLGELFNGDKVEVFQRKGNWYKIATADLPILEGWVHKNWLRNSCPY